MNLKDIKSAHKEFGVVSAPYFMRKYKISYEDATKYIDNYLKSTHCLKKVKRPQVRCERGRFLESV